MLERSAGMQLLDRPGGRRAVTPTEAGERLLRHARRAAAAMRAAEADLRALAEGEAGTLRVGTFQSVGVRMIPPVMRLYVKRRPAIQVRLDRGPPRASDRRARPRRARAGVRLRAARRQHRPDRGARRPVRAAGAGRLRAGPGRSSGRGAGDRPAAARGVSRLQRGRRGIPTRQGRRSRDRVPVGRQRHRAGARRCRDRLRARPAAHRRPYRSRTSPSSMSAGCRHARSASRGTRTGRCRLPRAPSSRSSRRWLPGYGRVMRGLPGAVPVCSACTFCNRVLGVDNGEMRRSGTSESAEYDGLS